MVSPSDSPGNKIAPAAIDPVVFELADRQQMITRREFDRGEEKRYELKEISADRSAPGRAAAANDLYRMVQQVDKLAGARIALVERLKKELFTGLGQHMTGGNSIVMRAYDPQEPLRIAVYDLSKMTAGGHTDLVSFASGKGKELMQSMQEYRNALTETIATYTSGDHEFGFTAPQVTRYSDFDDLLGQVDKAIAASNVAPDDGEMVRKLYTELTRAEDHWKWLLHGNCHWVTAFHLLTELEYEVLRSRADAIALIRSRTGGDNYAFDKITVVTSGPEYVKAGTEIDFEVFVGALNSDSQPVVTIDGGSAHLVETAGGKARVRVSAPDTAGEIEIAGMIRILNKAGIPKTLPWKKKIVVGK